MKVNFEIEENYAVIYNTNHIDLHNNFEFHRILENKKEVHLEFKKSKGNWVHKNEFTHLTFIIKNVSYKYFADGDNSKFPEDENTLSIISFFPSTMRNINDGHIEQKNPKENNDIIFSFENGKIFRLNCEEVELKVQN